MNKTHILFIQPLFFDPTLPNFKDRFELLSEQGLSGHIISSTDQPKKYDGLKFGNFTYHAIPFIKNRYIKLICQMYKTVTLGIKLNKAQRFDYIHSYDPLLFGFAAVLIRMFTKSKLITEVNGHLKKDGFLEQQSFKATLKKNIFTFLASTVLKRSSVIKFLNSEQKEEWSEFLKDQKVVMYHDFVPTHVFKARQSGSEKYVFFIGYPFYRKAVDILIKAFLKISAQCPDVKLKIVGHCPGGDAERQKYIDMTQGNQNIEILKPVYFDAAIKLFEECLFFVLPSRSEAMGRVIIEAMACAKAVIGSRVGGIPGLVTDNENGYLFESENIDELAEKMKKLIMDDQERTRLGENALKGINNTVSSEKYVEYFIDMLKGT